LLLRAPSTSAELAVLLKLPQRRVHCALDDLRCSGQVKPLAMIPNPEYNGLPGQMRYLKLYGLVEPLRYDRAGRLLIHSPIL